MLDSFIKVTVRIGYLPLRKNVFLLNNYLNHMLFHYYMGVTFLEIQGAGHRYQMPLRIEFENLDEDSQLVAELLAKEVEAGISETLGLESTRTVPQWNPHFLSGTAGYAFDVHSWRGPSHDFSDTSTEHSLKIRVEPIIAQKIDGEASTRIQNYILSTRLDSLGNPGYKDMLSDVAQYLWDLDELGDRICQTHELQGKFTGDFQHVRAFPHDVSDKLKDGEVEYIPGIQGRYLTVVSQADGQPIFTRGAYAALTNIGGTKGPEDTDYLQRLMVRMENVYPVEIDLDKIVGLYGIGLEELFIAPKAGPE